MGGSVLWAPWNVGAARAEEYGAYFAWGEINGRKESYDWEFYVWMAEGMSDMANISKYQVADGQTDGDWYAEDKFVGDGKSSLETADDAASANWGNGWRTPKVAELEELMDKSKCQWTWTLNYKGTGVNGYVVKSLTTNGELFLPAAGCRWSVDLYRAGDIGYYWSAELMEGYTDFASYMVFDSEAQKVLGYDRYNGFAIRAVIERGK